MNIILIIISFAVALLALSFRAISILYSSYISLALFTILTYLVLNRNSKKRNPLKSLLDISVGVFIIILLHIIPDVIYNIPITSSWHPLIIGSILFYFIGIIAGYILFKSNNIYKGVTILLLFLISYVYYSVFVPMIITKHNEGTYFTEVKNGEKYEFNLQDSLGSNISLSSFKNKIIVLDFWYTQCGNCYTTMPHFSELYEKYKDNSDIEFYVVHCYDEKESASTGVKILSQRGFHIPSLSTEYHGETLKLLNIDRFPKCIIFNSNSELIFRGDVSLIEKTIKKSLNIN